MKLNLKAAAANCGNWCRVPAHSSLGILCTLSTLYTHFAHTLHTLQSKCTVHIEKCGLGQSKGGGCTHIHYNQLHVNLDFHRSEARASQIYKQTYTQKLIQTPCEPTLSFSLYETRVTKGEKRSTHLSLLVYLHQQINTPW